ncbi:hypothetical protein [Paludibaculum fermentans]|uniref:Glycosyltransferase RgtA/B/C/D-like domain-containing protein n=1 Tax=Paludibaculum fermentans TaxID=1473598 RepID=A0A7S7NKU5_PALFE|nr:hypothetical protein [Paludibaculum fermentans]QOY85503.1 hypothetical protein IRI77_22040 [Paludibaculum fermentans]
MIRTSVPPAGPVHYQSSASSTRHQAEASPRTFWPLPEAQTRVVCRWLLLALAALYLIQIPTPLRLNYDSVHLLGVGENLAEGRGFIDHGQRPVFPPGFPLVVAALLRTGLMSPAALALFNLAMLAVGLLAIRRILMNRFDMDESTVLGVACLFLLSVVVIKHSMIPLTDVPFFAISMAALASMERLRDLKLGWKLCLGCALALLLVCCATLVRTIGVALWPAWLWCVLSNRSVRVHTARIPRKLVAAVALLLLAAVAVVAWKLTLILRNYFLQFVGAQAWYQFLWGLAEFRLMEFGQLFLNLPKGVLPLESQWIVRLPGALLLAATVAGLLGRRRDLSSTDVYFGFYGLILAIWPHFDSRFWLPVLPLLVAYAFRGVEALPLPAAISRWSPVVLALYAIIGLTSLAYSTQLTYSGRSFPSLYPEYSASYCAEAYTCGKVDPNEEQDPDAIHILRRFR